MMDRLRKGVHTASFAGRGGFTSISRGIGQQDVAPSGSRINTTASQETSPASSIESDSSTATPADGHGALLAASNASSDCAGDAESALCAALADISADGHFEAVEPVAVPPGRRLKELEANTPFSAGDGRRGLIPTAHKPGAADDWNANDWNAAGSLGRLNRNVEFASPMGAGVPAHTSIHSMGLISESPKNSHEDADVVIPADATLVDGLRILVLHHLRRSIGTKSISLSSTQAELLDHHVVRLASYAQKVVHTLAFAARCLVKPKVEDDRAGVVDSSLGPRAEGGGGGVRRDDARGAAPRAFPQKPQRAPRPARKPLKLNDDEILTLYRNAQREAAIEADWRGIQGPSPSRDGASDDCTNRSFASGAGLVAADAASDVRDADKEYVRMFSRALQQPGRSPRTFTAEIMDPSRETVCCQPRVGTVLNEVIGRAATLGHTPHAVDTDPHRRT